MAAAINLKKKMLEQSRTDKILMPQTLGPCALFGLQPPEKQSRENEKITLTGKQRFSMGLGSKLSRQAIEPSNLTFRDLTLDMARNP